MYIDPGSGSVILQVILGALLTGSVLIKVFWRKIRALFSKNDSSNSSN